MVNVTVFLDDMVEARAGEIPPAGLGLGPTECVRLDMKDGSRVTIHCPKGAGQAIADALMAARYPAGLEAV
jgi:hypothetical protein